MKWPAKIPAGSTTDAMMMTIDILPTIAHVIEAKLPNHKIDGLNCWPIIAGEKGAVNPHDFYAFYYEQNQLQAISSGDGHWKLQLPHKYRSIAGVTEKAQNGIPVLYKQQSIEQPELYDLYTDLSESKNVASEHPDEVEKLQKHAQTMRTELGDSLMKRPTGSGTREPGRVKE
jgi:arylsulfatase